MSNNKVMQGFKCDLEHECIRSTRSKGPYGDWSSEYRNTLKSISLVSEYPDLVAPLDVKSGDQVYVIWCEWSDGDSFGHSENGGCEVMAVFKDSDSAMQYAQWLDKSYKDYKKDESSNSKTRKLSTADGQVFELKGYAPWEGYFERLNQIHFQMMVVNPSFDFGEDSKIRVG